MTISNPATPLKRPLMIFIQFAIVAALLAGAYAWVSPAEEAQANEAEFEEALERINTYRAWMGVEPLRMDDSLMAAAQSHADYWARNDGNMPGLHNQTPGASGFTGATMSDRAEHFGYSGSINENVGLSGSMVSTVDWSIATINHRLTLIDPRYTDIGFGAVNTGNGGMETIKLGTQSWSDTVEPEWQAWPVDGTSNIGHSYLGSAPSPFANVPYPVGYPITLKYNGEGNVQFQSVTLSANGSDVSILAEAGDGWLSRNTMMILATEPLEPNTTYDVSIEASANGENTSHSWSFTTGESNTSQPTYDGEAGEASSDPPAAREAPEPPEPSEPADPSGPEEPSDPSEAPDPEEPTDPGDTPDPDDGSDARGSSEEPVEPEEPETETSLPEQVSTADPAFQRTWSASDSPVYEDEIDRSWLWGPDTFELGHEAYTDAPDGERDVAYFDKSRMEINNPNGNESSEWYVTNGLLVRDMVRGVVQTGDQEFEQQDPAQITIAGDDLDVNPDAPTYASLRPHSAGFNDDENRQEDRTGEAVKTRITAHGRVLHGAEMPDGVTYGHYDEETGFNIADVFWDAFSSADHYDWLYAVGHPITDPHWVYTSVDGVDQWVLVQAFQRRVLTFSPENAAGWQIEMGNVGRHYFEWRYGEAP